MNPAVRPAYPSLRSRKDNTPSTDYKGDMKRPMSAIRLLDLPVNRLLRCWPKASQAFIASQMACIGCAFDRFHTLRQALEIYGIDPDAFFELLQQSGPVPNCIGNLDSKED